MRDCGPCQRIRRVFGNPRPAPDKSSNLIFRRGLTKPARAFHLTMSSLLLGGALYLIWWSLVIGPSDAVGVADRIARALAG